MKYVVINAVVMLDLPQVDLSCIPDMRERSEPVLFIHSFINN